VFTWLDRLVEALLTAVLALLVIIGGAQIVWRFVLNNPLSWAIETSIILMVWATMLSGYVGVRRNVHLSADFAGMSLRPAARWYLDLVSLLLCGVFVAVYGWASLVVIDSMEGIPFTSIPVTQPALYWSLPVSAVLMALALLDRMWRHVGQRPRKV
jgi:TRAP-type C4-dicarboxylate transport system permease small subunit